jgi:hypothetical protein
MALFATERKRRFERNVKSALREILKEGGNEIRLGPGPPFPASSKLHARLIP